MKKIANVRSLITLSAFRSAADAERHQDPAQRARRSTRRMMQYFHALTARTGRWQETTEPIAGLNRTLRGAFCRTHTRHLRGELPRRDLGHRPLLLLQSRKGRFRSPCFERCLRAMGQPLIAASQYWLEQIRLWRRSSHRAVLSLQPVFPEYDDTMSSGDHCVQLSHPIQTQSRPLRL
jgi:hypothetical protein